MARKPKEPKHEFRLTEEQASAVHAALAKIGGQAQLQVRRTRTWKGRTTLVDNHEGWVTESVQGVQARLFIEDCGSSLGDLSILAELDFEVSEVEVSYSHSLKDLRGLEHLKGLQKVVVFSERLRSLDGLPCDSLTELSVSGCGRLECLGGLVGARGLQRLDLSSCTLVADLSPLSGLNQLQSLNLADCRSLLALTDLDSLSALTELDVSLCDAVVDLTPIQGLVGLKSLNLAMMKGLEDLSPLRALGELEQLELEFCESLKDLSPLSALVGLKVLRAGGIPPLDVSPIMGLTQLEVLDLSMGRWTELPSLSDLPKLHELDLKANGKLRAAPGLSSLSGLTEVDLAACEELEDIAGLAGCVGLEVLDLSSCSKLRDIGPLRGLPALWSLDLQFAAALDEVAAFEVLRTLPVLTDCEGPFSQVDLIKLIASKTDPDGDLEGLESLLDEWLEVARLRPEVEGLLGALGWAAGCLPTEERLEPLVELLTLVRRHGPLGAGALLRVALGDVEQEAVFEALSELVLQREQPLGSAVLLALSDELGALTDGHPRAAWLSEQVIPRAVEAWLQAGAWAGDDEAWQDAERCVQGLSRAVHLPWSSEAIDACLDGLSVDALSGQAHTLVLTLMACRVGLLDPDAGARLCERLSHIGVGLDTPQARRALFGALANGVSMSPDRGWATAMLDRLLLRVAEARVDSVQLRAEVARMQASEGQWDAALETVAGLASAADRDPLLVELMALAVPGQVVFAVELASRMANVEGRCRALESLVPAAAHHPAAYGRLLLALADQPDATHRAVAEAVRRVPELAQVPQTVSTVPHTWHERHLLRAMSDRVARVNPELAAQLNREFELEGP